MRKLAIFFLLGVLCSMGLLAHGEAKTGILADGHCGPGMVGDEAKASDHKVTCALSCKDNGFGIIADGKFYPFDEAGNKQALALLEATDKASALKVKVEGDFEEDLIKVSSMEAVE